MKIKKICYNRQKREGEIDMDLTLDVEDYKLNVRAAGVIIHNGKILVHRNVNSDHYALIGGRVEIGEDSASTVKREVEKKLERK